jgi:hypothetical protein
MERKAVSQNPSRPFGVPQLFIKRARPTQFYLDSVGIDPDFLSRWYLARWNPFLRILRTTSILVAETIAGHDNVCNPAFTNDINEAWREIGEFK